MKLIIQIACGILLARCIIGCLESPALFEAAKLWLKLLYIAVMIPITCVEWSLRGIGAVCRWIDAPRKHYGLGLSVYYILLAIPALAGFLIPCDLVWVQNAPLSSADDPVLVNALATIGDLSMLASILLGLSCAVAYHTGGDEVSKPGAADDTRPSGERTWLS